MEKIKVKDFLTENPISEKSTLGIILNKGVFKLGVISIKSRFDNIRYAYAYISKDKKQYVSDTGCFIGGVTGLGVYPENVETFGKERFDKAQFIQFYKIK